MVGSVKQPKLENSYVCPSCGRQFTDKLDFCPYDGVRLLSGEENSNSLKRVGAVIGGRYHVDGVLGHGGMGTVFRAVQQPIGRRVAVKVLHPELAQDDTFVSRFHTEAKAASVLVNPNTVTIYDFGQTEDRTLFIAMEYLRGVSLAHCLGRGALPWKQAAAIGVQVCRALSEAHRKGIVHRDLKPENIMLNSADDGSLLIKVLDFGIAKMLEVPGRSHLKGVPVTQVGVIIGTPQYMSPEQVRGGEPSSASDLYALGIILYEAISGAVPFQEEEPILLLGMHMKSVPPPLTSPFGDFPPAMSTLISQLLSKEPGDRPGPAADVGSLLKQIMGDATFNAVELLGDHGQGSDTSPPGGLSVVADDGIDEEEEREGADTIERQAPSKEDIERAETALNGRPESSDVISDDDPTGPRTLPESAVVEDEEEGIDDLPNEATKRIIYPSAVVEEEQGEATEDKPRLPKEEDRTTMRSVVVEPTPPEAAGLRPDQILPGDAQSVAATQQVLHEEDEPLPKSRFLIVLLVVLVMIAGALTGIFTFSDIWQPTPPQLEDTASLVGNPSGTGQTPDNSLVSGEVSSDASTKGASVDSKVLSDEPPEKAAPDAVQQGDAGTKVIPEKVPSQGDPSSKQQLHTTVQFVSSPADAEVYVSGKQVCVTPCSELLPTGRRVKIRFKLRGMRTRMLSIVPGRDKVVQVTLRRIRPATQQTKKQALEPWL